MRLIVLMLIPLLMLVPTPVLADAAHADALAGRQVTVRELMRLDTELALEAARRRLGRNERAASEPAARLPHTLADAHELEAPRLVGIYGVGQRLFAEVHVGGQRLLYVKGHPLPIGYEAATDAYRLRSLAGHCVLLERGDDETRLCLSRAKEE
ncbi:hypothetical protein [Yanghanlia caeni]|uniref:Type IV pilus biogenesis protein PilP n=1 Tax=Yanghanlia caeni TaxID=3064283 RepID=A0ABU1D3B7_9BURK|nr:hypothetical protein [Alcaligenaceae bacterium LG-2]